MMILIDFFFFDLLACGNHVCYEHFVFESKWTEQHKDDHHVLYLLKGLILWMNVILLYFDYAFLNGSLFAVKLSTLECLEV